MAHIIDWFFNQIQVLPPAMALVLVGLGMMLESMCVPIPSEAILPLAGICAAQGKFGNGATGFVAAVAAATVGCLIGSSIAYAIGYYGGTPLVERFGRYILVTHHRLEKAEKWLAKYGAGAIILGRLMFAIRALISYPVGVLRLPYPRFLLFTFLGCLTWNVLGVLLGFRYGEAVRRQLHEMSLGMFALLAFVVLILGGFYFWKTHVAVPKPVETDPSDG